MLNRVFNPDNFVWRNVGKLVDLVALSALWLVLSLPVVTIGPASAALYDTVVKCVRQNEPGPYRRFFRSFRGSCCVGIPASLIAAALLALLGYEYTVMETLAATGEPRYIALFVAFYVALLLPMGWVALLFPVLSRFCCTLPQLLSNTFRLAVKHLPSTVVMGLIVFEAAVFTLEHFYVAPLSPALAALLVSLFAERILRRYMPEELPADSAESAASCAPESGRTEESEARGSYTK